MIDVRQFECPSIFVLTIYNCNAAFYKESLSKIKDKGTFIIKLTVKIPAGVFLLKKLNIALVVGVGSTMMTLSTLGGPPPHYHQIPGPLQKV